MADLYIWDQLFIEISDTRQSRVNYTVVIYYIF